MALFTRYTLIFEEDLEFIFCLGFLLYNIKKLYILYASLAMLHSARDLCIFALLLGIELYSWGKAMFIATHETVAMVMVEKYKQN